MTDAACYFGEDLYFTPYVTTAAKVTAATTTAPAIATPAVLQWGNCIAAVTDALSPHRVTIQQVATKSMTGTTRVAVTKTEDALTSLLNAAYAIGFASTVAANPVGITATQHAVLGLRYRDFPVDGVQASGSLNVVASEPGVTRATFVIHAPSVKARTIVIVITVGGVKITITIRW